MKIIAAIICFFIAGCLVGCASVKIETPEFKAEYFRLWDQNIKKITITRIPDGYEIEVIGINPDAPIDPETFKLMLDAYLSTTGSPL